MPETSTSRAAGQPVHAGGDVDGDAADIAVEQLAFTSVKAGTDLQPELGKSVADRGGAADPARWAIEGREEAVPGALDLAAAEALELSADDSVVALEQVVPAPVAERGSALGLNQRCP